MINENFVILAALLSFYGGFRYFLATLKGETKPNKVSWFLWALIPMIALAAQLEQGVGITALMTFMVGFNPMLIFIASFVNKKSQWQIGRLDIFCLLFSLLGVILWYITNDPNMAILFSILADGLAGVPTIIKSYSFPETENYSVSLFAAISAAITLLTIKTWDFAHFGFPLYIFILCVILVVLIKFKIGAYVKEAWTKK